MAFDPLAALTNMTRKAFDDELNRELLDKHTSAISKLLMNPKTQAGRALAGNILYREHGSRWVTSGLEQYGREIIQPFASIQLEWVRFTKSMTIDGFDYEKNSGQMLEDAMSGDSGSFSVGGARTLIALHKEELMGLRAEILRDLNKAVYRGGGVRDPNHQGFQGFQQIMDPEASYGGIAPDGLGEHDWDSALTGDRPSKWQPIYYNAEGRAVSLFGEIESMMIDLHRGGSQHTPMGVTNEFNMFIAQRQYSNMLRHESIRGALRRPITESGGANPDISGFMKPLVWDDYNLKIYPDTDCPLDEIYVYNTNCLKFGQINTDTTFMRKWRLADNQDSLMIPFLKSCQLWCNDRSQTGRIVGIGGAGITE